MQCDISAFTRILYQYNGSSLRKCILMCGLTGFYDLKAQRRRSEHHKIAQVMTQALYHRGPDQGDVWQDPDVPLALGHRRLSIMDLTETGRQPMESPSGRFMTVFNGEIYNVLSLRAELEAQGITFRGHSDTEVMLAGFDQWGVNLTLQKINGMFAIVLWDRRDRTLHFMRDRMGKKPLYIGWAGENLVFGSELKSLRAHPDYQTRLNKGAAALYFRYACVPAPHCIDEGVWQLPPGHSLSLKCEEGAFPAAGSDLSQKMLVYWNAASVAQDAQQLLRTDQSEQDVVQEFEALLTQCVRDRMISDVPLGAFLSGGIDSSTIVALMQGLQDAPVKTYSIGFEEAGFDEASFAKKVAAHIGTDHHEMYVTQRDALDVIPSLPAMYDEPFADISAIPTALVSRFARQGVTVALSGDGGDEMLGGYNRHIEAPRLWGKLGRLPLTVRRMIAASIIAVPTAAWDKILPMRPQAGTALHKVAGLLQQDSREDVYDRLCSHWEDGAVTAQGITSPDLWTQRDEYNLQGLGFAEEMMVWDALSYLPNDILVKVDRASMDCALEVRAPLLDPRIYEYAWTLPLSYKIKQGQGKWLLRQVLQKHVPAELFERPKQGFSMPVGAWLRGDLRDWAEDLLSAQNLQKHGILKKDVVQRTWQAHLDGHGAHATQLWAILMFQSWAQKWL